MNYSPNDVVLFEDFGFAGHDLGDLLVRDRNVRDLFLDFALFGDGGGGRLIRQIVGVGGGGRSPEGFWRAVDVLDFADGARGAFLDDGTLLRRDLAGSVEMFIFLLVFFFFIAMKNADSSSI